MATKKFVVSGYQRLGIVDKCWEIQRQLKLANGSPHDPRLVDRALQDIIEGRFPMMQTAISPPHGPELEVVKAILTEIESITIDTDESLILSDFYLTDGKKPGGVKIGYISETFGRLMAAVKEPVSVLSGERRVHRLDRCATTGQIVNAIEPERRFNSFAVAAGEMSIMLKKQPYGESGKLRTNSYATLFVYTDGVVYCGWCSDDRGWDVEAYPITLPGEWRDGGQVVSC